jgi:Flp pilus assembly pilin Flp
MSRTRRSAETGTAERGATAVTYALMIAVVALLVSVGFMVLHGGVAANLRRGGDCLVSLDSGQGCPSGGLGPSGGPGTLPDKTTTSSSSTTSTTGPS